MPRLLWLVAAFAERLLASQPGTSFKSTNAVYNNRDNYYFDIDGNAITSTNGKVQWIKDQYLWVAEPMSCGQPLCDKISYTSNDLRTWVPNGPLFNISTPTNAAACSGFGSCSRPKIVYNERTKKYVFYGFVGRPGSPGPAVFVSGHLTYGYTFVGHMTPTLETGPGYVVEDLGVSVIDGKGYLAYTAFNLTQTQLGYSSIWPPFLQTVAIQPLTPDFLNVSGPAHAVVDRGGSFPVTETSGNLLDGQIESPDLIKRGDTYYVFGSATCAFCNGTLTVAYRSKSISGPWTRQIVDSSDTCGGQAMGVMTVPAVGANGQPTFIYHADRFSTSPPGLSFTGAAGHGFYKLSFAADGSLGKIDCSPDTSYQFVAPLGAATIPKTNAIAASADGSGNDGGFSSSSDIPAAAYYQTWTASKSGTLTKLGINLASYSPTNNLSITLFRFSNEQELQAPLYKYEMLGTNAIGAATPGIEYFTAKELAFQAKVTKGDKLGFVLGGGYGGLAPSPPYGFLKRYTTQPGHSLFALTRGHVSLDGLQGDVSPLRRLSGQELKWYAHVE